MVLLFGAKKDLIRNFCHESGLNRLGNTFYTEHIISIGAYKLCWLLWVGPSRHPKKELAKHLAARDSNINHVHPGHPRHGAKYKTVRALFPLHRQHRRRNRITDDDSQ